jgi:8-oxo-dGTP pyrophosphatase MutT (NUDIX family)
MVDGTLEVMLLTSRGTGRWIIPKGWPIDGLGSSGSAAQEAYEEAGVIGAISDSSIGSYTYEKIRAEGGSVECIVHVHSLEVEEQMDDWPEREERETAWFLRQEAAGLVAEPELRAIILGFVAPLPFG